MKYAALFFLLASTIAVIPTRAMYTPVPYTVYVPTPVYYYYYPKVYTTYDPFPYYYPYWLYGETPEEYAKVAAVGLITSLAIMVMATLVAHTK